MKSKAVSYGAATIVNAIATGKGAAFGIDLETKASVELNDSGVVHAQIKDFAGEDTRLIELCSSEVFNYFGVDYGINIETQSNIPVARGLKSSSAAANAVVLETVDAVLKEHPEFCKPGDLELIGLGVNAAVKAGVTITGAFDDASASYLGGFVVTDNTKRIILKSGRMESCKVLLFVPEQKTYTAGVDVDRVKLLANEVSVAWGEALKGNIYSAMNLNGVLYSSTLNQDPSIALAALEAGALAAGLCGTGPAVAALVEDDIEALKVSWEGFDGRIIEANTNNKCAKVL